MSHRTRIRPSLAAWTNGSAVLSTDYDSLDAAQFSSIDGDAGGIWIPSSKITISGANGLDVLAPFRAMSSFFSARMVATNWPERGIGPGSIAAVNSDFAVAWLPTTGGTSSSLWGILNTSKTLYVSADALSWNAILTLPNCSTTKPEMAAGMLDGVPALMTNGGVGANFYTIVSGSVSTLRVGGPAGTSANVPCYAPSLHLWVFVGTQAFSTGDTTAAMSAWSSAATLPATWTSNSGGCKRLVWNGSLFVALPVSSYNKCLTSPDGNNWTERTLPAAGLWTGVAYSATDGLWMAVASNLGNGAVSSDGLTWVAPTGTLYTVGNDLACLNSLWIMPTTTANYGGLAWSTDKGASWTRGPSVGDHSVATAGWKRILAGDNRFMVAHETGSNIEVALSLRSS